MPARSLDDLRVFVAVAEAGGFARAARRLALSRAAVSKSLARLEGEVGARLVARTTRAVAPTEAGLAYLPAARAALAALGEAEAGLAALRGEPSGTLRVSAPLAFGRLVVVPGLPGFLGAHPRVAVEVALSDQLARVPEEGVDTLFRIAPAPDSGLVFRKLWTPVFKLVAAPGYLARAGAPASPEELERHAYAAMASPLTGRPYPLRLPGAADGGAETRIMPPARVVLSDGGAAVAAAAAGLGVAQMPDYLVDAGLAAGELVEVLPEARVPGRPVAIGYAPDRLLLPKVRAFVDFWAGQASLRGAGRTPEAAERRSP